MLHIKRELIPVDSEVLCSCGKSAIVKWSVNIIWDGKIISKELHKPQTIYLCTACHKKEVDNWNKTGSPFISKKMTYNLEDDKPKVISNTCQHDIGIEFSLNKKDGKIYVLSGCIILATFIQQGKKDSYKIKYQSLEIDRTVGQSNNSGHLRYTLSQAFDHILARVHSPYGVPFGTP